MRKSTPNRADVRVGCGPERGLWESTVELSVLQHLNRRHYLLASDFDQTLSFNDSGLVLSELLGIHGYEERVAGLALSNLIQQGGELAYLIRHDPEFRGVRQEHLVEAGKR